MTATTTKTEANYPQAGETWRPKRWRDDSADITFEDSAPLCVFVGSGFMFTSAFVKAYEKVAP